MMRNEMDWNGGMDNGILCTVYGTIAHCVLAAFVPFHLRRVSFNIAVGY